MRCEQNAIAMTQDSFPRVGRPLLLGLTGGLLFVYSLPHVIALRYLLLLAAFLMSAKASWGVLRSGNRYCALTIALATLAVLQLWMLVVVIGFAENAVASIGEWKGQWLTAMMALSTGIGTAAVICRMQTLNARSVCALTIAVPVTALIILHDAVVLGDMLKQGSLLTQHAGITDHKANISFAFALLEPILVADMLSRLVHRRGLLPFPSWVGLLILALSVFALLTAGARNGLITIFFAFLLGGAAMLPQLKAVYSRRRLVVSSIAGLTLIITYAVVALKTDPRWQNFLETLPIAWDIEGDTRWLNGDGSDLPIAPSGKPVEASAYYRIAWAHEGARMLIERPLGTEINRGTFNRLLLEKYGHTGASHTHNGWLDMGLNVGFPGLILWAGFLLLLARMGWRMHREHADPLGFALFLLVATFAFRALLDTTFREHPLAQFMLVAGLLAGTLTKIQRGESVRA